VISSQNGLVSFVPAEQIPDNSKIVVKGAYYVSATGTSLADE
jgi:hypothetical protein